MKLTTFAVGFAVGAWVGCMIAVTILATDAYLAWKRNAEQEASDLAAIEWAQS